MCMEYEAFTEKFKTCMEQELGEGNEVSFSSMEKINQVEWKGLQVRREGEGTAAILPLRGMYAEYQKGGMGQAVKTAAQMLVRKPDISAEGLLGDWESAKGRIFPVLLHAEWNQKLLMEAPHREFLDLALVYRLESELAGGGASTIVKAWFLEQWGITEEELGEAAMKRLRREAYSIRPLLDTVKGFLTETGLDTMMQEGLGQFQDFPELYVLSNQQGCYGAAGILRRDLLKEFSERVQSSFYILPSSLHETILMVEKADVRGGELRELVMSINEAEVAREEWLSENVYYYDKEKADVRIAE